MLVYQNCIFKPFNQSSKTSRVGKMLDLNESHLALDQAVFSCQITATSHDQKPQKVGKERKSPYFRKISGPRETGKSRLVKYHNLARWLYWSTKQQIWKYFVICFLDVLERVKPKSLNLYTFETSFMSLNVHLCVTSPERICISYLVLLVLPQKAHSKWNSQHFSLKITPFTPLTFASTPLATRPHMQYASPNSRRHVANHDDLIHQKDAMPYAKPWPACNVGGPSHDGRIRG